MSPPVIETRTRSSTWIARTVVAALCGCVLALFTGSGPACAHAILQETTPSDNEVLDAAPASAELRFNEPVDLINGAIRLFPSDGHPQTLEAETRDHSVIVDLPQDLPKGTYLLSYRVVSADGHPVGGAVAFHIGEKSASSPAPSAPDTDVTPMSTETAVVVLTTVQYLGLLIFAGLLFFNTVILRAPGQPDSGTRILSQWAAGCAAAASLVLIPVSALRITGRSLVSFPELGLWESGLRPAPMVVAAVVLLTGFSALLLFNRSLRGPVRHAAVVAAALAAISPVLVGHSQTTDPIWLMIAADIGHLLAGSFWVGGVIGLFRTVRSAGTTQQGDSDNTDRAILATARFSRCAIYSVILLALSGTLMAALIISTPSQLVATGYGRTLLIKLAIVASIIAIAGWNRKRILPAVAAEPTVSKRWEGLRRTLSYEAALLCAVVVVTGLLSNSSPDHQHEQTQPSHATTVDTAIHARSQGLVVDGDVEPASAGANTLSFHLTYDGEGVTDDSVDISARLPEQQLGPFETTATRDPDTGEFEAPLTLPVSGDWQVQVTVRVSRFEQPIAVVPVHIH